VAAARDLLDDLDLLLVMSVNPGFGGQTFLPVALRKLREARALLDSCRSACELEVDGGVKLDNAPEVARAGATVMVAGSFVYTSGEIEANVQALRAAIS
jgi:ribulose-phosphate 3-epimerase